jgi:hypothetical protein
MKIILLVEILSLAFVKIPAQKTITCFVIKESPSRCGFSVLTLGPQEAISIKTHPENTDDNTITITWFLQSTIHSIPSEVFTKYPNLDWFQASGQKVQEIRPGTFRNGKKLTHLSLQDNEMTFLHKDTFEGKCFSKYFFCKPLILGNSIQRFAKFGIYLSL